MTVAERQTIEVVCESKMCFRVDAQTLEPLGTTYYEPAALSDPRGPQMSHSEWCLRRNEQRNAGVAPCQHNFADDGVCVFCGADLDGVPASDGQT